MGLISELDDNIVIASNENLIVYDKRNLKGKVLETPAEKISENKEKINEIKDDTIICIATSETGEYLASATKSKRLIVWNTTSWNICKEELLFKQPMSLSFLPNSSKVVVADKNGDVYGMSIDEQSEKISCLRNSSMDGDSCLELLLGHLSMLLDLAVTTDGKYLITSDRDEKIRVSCFPNCYNIHTFCLGHTEFVSQVKLLPNHADYLLSASGDGKVKLWNILEGKCCLTHNVKEDLESLLKRHFLRERGRMEELEAIIKDTFVSVIRIFPRPKEKYLVSLYFHGSTFLVFYDLDKVKCELRLMDFCQTKFPLRDFTFLSDGGLLGLMDTSEDQSQNPLVLYEIADNLTSYHTVEDHPVIAFGKQYREKLKAQSTWGLDAESLYKHNKYDNVGEYQKKKLERIGLDSHKRKSCEL